MAHSENMTQKSDYQLNWIIANKPTYSENQIKAAFEELKRREKVNLKVEDIKNNFKKLRDSIYRFFK
jgi:glutathione peroxidase-family protein